MAYPMYEVDWSVLPPEQNRRQVQTTDFSLLIADSAKKTISHDKAS